MAFRQIVFSLVMALAFLVLVEGETVTINQCIVCKSVEDPNCLFRPQLLAPVTCPTIPVAQAVSCFTKINADGGTERGCLAEPPSVTACSNNVNCTNCLNEAGLSFTDSCNRNGVAPTNRIRCHTCHGSRYGPCGVEMPADEAQYCPVFVAAEQRCFTRRSDRFIDRGCVSNTTFCSNPTECLFCNGTGCNSLPETDKTIPFASSANWLSITPLPMLAALALLLCKKIEIYV